MIKQVEDIYKEYEKFTFVKPKDYKFVLCSLMVEKDSVSYLDYNYIIDDCVVFGDELLPTTDYRINKYSDTEKRVLSGYKMCINFLIQYLTIDNFVEIEKLRSFLACKLNKNIAKIEISNLVIF